MYVSVDTIAKSLAAKTWTRSKPLRQAEEVNPEVSDETLDNIREVKQSKAPPIKALIIVDGVCIQMEVDTGALVSLVSWKLFG